MVASATPYCELSDSQLFNYVKEDDKQAFKEIYNRYWSYLIDVAYRPLQCRQKSEDLVQEIFISLYQRRHSIELTVSLKAYLSKALKFKVMNEYRSKTVRENYQKNFFFNNSSKNDFADQYEVKELEQAIYSNVMLLPEKCRQVFLLSRNEDYSHKAISGGLGISVSTVEKHIIKALKTLKVNLNL